MKLCRLLLVRGGNYHQYDGKKLNEAELLTKLSDGSLLITHLLDHNINFCFSDEGFSSKIIAEKLYKANKLDLLIRGNISVLLSMIDGKTYLDFILDGIKDKSIKHNLNEISIEGCTVAELA